VAVIACCICSFQPQVIDLSAGKNT
jgi:hypothetical protein